MTSTRYLGSITPPPPSVSITSSAGSITLAKAGTWYFWGVNRCVGGFTKASVTASSVTVAAGDRINITIPASAKTTGSDVREFYVLASQTNNSTTASFIASYPGYTLDPAAQSPTDYSESPTALPALIEIETDEQLELNKLIPTLGDLPTGADLLNGMIRNVDAEGTYFTYNVSLLNWFQLLPPTTNPNVGTASDPAGKGCDRDVDAFTASSASEIITPIYGLTGISRAVPLIIANTDSTNVLTGKAVEITTLVGVEDISRYITLTPRGIVDLTTGTLDTSGQPSIGGSFPADGEGGSVIALEKDLEPGKGFWFDARISFSTADLSNNLREGSLVKFSASFGPFNSKQTPDAGIFGDVIGPLGDHGRIVPNGPGLTPIITSRAGKIRGYTFPVSGTGILGASDVPGLLGNTADQNIIITNNGAAYQSPTIPSTAALRAIASTSLNNGSATDGVGEATAFAGSYTVGATTFLTITLTHPSTVRADYPDIIGVQQQPATLNASSARIYTRPVGGGNITYFDVAITGLDGETVTVGQVAGTTIGTSTPAIDADFGLFTVETYSPVTSTGGSVFAAGNIEVAFAYQYSGTLTRITHDPLDLEVVTSQYARELPASIFALFGLFDTIGLPLSTVVAAKALTGDDIATFKLFFVAETEKLYYWNPTSTDTADDVNIIAITGIATGRLIAISGSGGGSASVYVTGNLTLDTEIPTDYIVDASAGAITLTLDEAVNVDALAKHRITRVDGSGFAVTLATSGADIINRTQDSLTSTPVYLGDLVTVWPDKNPVDVGYTVSIENSAGIDSRLEKLSADRYYYLSSTGNDNNDGLTVGTPFKSMLGLATALTRLDLGKWNVTASIAAGETVELIPGGGSGDLTLNPGASNGGRVGIVGSAGSTISYSGSNNWILINGNDVVFFELTIATGVGTPQAIQFVSGCKLQLTNVVIDTTLSPGMSQLLFGEGDFKGDGTSLQGSGFSTVGNSYQKIATLNNVFGSFSSCTFSNTGAMESLFNCNGSTLDYSICNDSASSVSVAGYVADDSIIRLTSVTSTYTGKKFALKGGSRLNGYGVTLSGDVEGTVDVSSFYDGYAAYNFPTTNLGTFSATGSVDWDLDFGAAPNDAVLTITDGVITWTVSNVPDTISYKLTGYLDIDISVTGEVVLPVGWTVAAGSADPNLATGVYSFVVDYNSVLAITYVKFTQVV